MGICTDLGEVRGDTGGVVGARTHRAVDQRAALCPTTHQAVTLGGVAELVNALVAVPEGRHGVIRGAGVSGWGVWITELVVMIFGGKMRESESRVPTLTSPHLECCSWVA